MQHASTFTRMGRLGSRFTMIHTHVSRNLLSVADAFAPPLLTHPFVHADGGREKREDFTMGASFGDSRKLTFLHPSSGATFDFPQNNGDIFAFTTEANKRFQHGVPRAKRNACGPRFSIIAWGRRREINRRNGALSEIALLPEDEGGHSKMDWADWSEDTKENKQKAARPATSHSPPSQDRQREKEIALEVGEVGKLVETFVLREDEKSAKLQAQGGRTAFQVRRKIRCVVDFHFLSKLIQLNSCFSVRVWIPPGRCCEARRHSSREVSRAGGLEQVCAWRWLGSARRGRDGWWLPAWRAGRRQQCQARRSRWQGRKRRRQRTRWCN